MMSATNRLHRLFLLISLLTAGAALLATGCLWGVVKDGATGAPVSGASVTYVDSYGHTGTATTNSKGLYAFDLAAGSIPAAGPVTLTVSASGYDTVSLPTLVQYDDNPNASLANLSSFWDVQSFVLAPSGTRTDMAVTDIYPDNQPSGVLWARITNNGPDSLVNAAVQVSCEATGHSTSICQEGTTSAEVSGIVSSNPGETKTVNTNVATDTSLHWYEATCTVQPLNGSYSDPNTLNDSYTEIIPPPSAATGDLELQGIVLSPTNQVGIGIWVSGTTSNQFEWTLNIGGHEYSYGGTAAPGVLWTPDYVTGTQTVSAVLIPCVAPETNPWNNQLVKTCSSASHSCW